MARNSVAVHDIAKPAIQTICGWLAGRCGGALSFSHRVLLLIVMKQENGNDDYVSNPKTHPSRIYLIFQNQIRDIASAWASVRPVKIFPEAYRRRHLRHASKPIVNDS